MHWRESILISPMFESKHEPLLPRKRFFCPLCPEHSRGGHLCCALVGFGHFWLSFFRKPSLARRYPQCGYDSDGDGPREPHSNGAWKTFCVVLCTIQRGCVHYDRGRAACTAGSSDYPSFPSGNGAAAQTAFGREGEIITHLYSCGFS